MAEENRITDDDVEFDPITYRTYYRAAFRERPVTGEVWEVLPDGTAVGMTTYRDGVQDGPERMFYGNGRLHAEGLWESSRRVGVHRVWDQEGWLAEEVEYAGGRTVRHTWYAADGKVVQERLSPGYQRPSTGDIDG